MARARKYVKSTKPAVTITVNRKFDVVLFPTNLVKLRKEFQDQLLELVDGKMQNDIFELNQSTTTLLLSRLDELITDQVLVEFLTALMESTQQPFDLMRDLEDSRLAIEDDEAQAAATQFGRDLGGDPAVDQALHHGPLVHGHQ